MSLRPDLVACWLFRLDAAGNPEILLIRRAPDRMYPGLRPDAGGEDGLAQERVE